MDLNKLGKLICKQAEEKGWGHTKETLVVSEKMMLIGTELTELEEARNNIVALPKDTMASEYADVLMRTLHLGTAWGVDFNLEIDFESKIKSKKGKFEILDLLYLHNLVTAGYENFRHKNIDEFLKCLNIIAREIVILSELEGVDIVEGFMNKININKDRVWDRSKLNGHYLK